MARRALPLPQVPTSTEVVRFKDSSPPKSQPSELALIRAKEPVIGVREQLRMAQRALVGGYRVQGDVSLQGEPDKALAAKVSADGSVEDEDKRNDESNDRKESLPVVPIVDRLSFNILVGIMTVANTVVIGLEQDLKTNENSTLWSVLSILFIIAFIFELVVRVAVDGWRFFCDVMNFFDLCLVVAASIDVFALTPAGGDGLIRVFTVFRTLRIIYLVKLVRMYRAFRELWLLVGGLANSMKALGWVGLMVLIVLYVCSIFVTTEIGHNDAGFDDTPSFDGEVWPYKEYFGTVWRSMFTLFQVLTLDSWCDDVVRHVIYKQPYMAVFFLLFLLVTSFGLMNVVVGIIVENTLVASQVADARVEHAEAQRKFRAVERLEEIFSLSDQSGQGKITLEELLSIEDSPIVTKEFQTIGLKFSEAKEIFTLLDYDRSGSIELRRFTAACRELCGGARRRDIVQVEITVGTLSQHLDMLDNKFSLVEEEVSSLQQMADEFVENTVRLLTGYDGKT